MRFKPHMGAIYFLASMVLAGSSAWAGESSLACFKKNFISSLRDTVATVRNPVALYSGKLTAGLDERSFAIFEKIRLDPAAELAEAEQSWLKERKLDSVLTQYRATAKLVRDVNHVAALSARSKPLNWNTLSWKQKARKWLTSWMAGFGVVSSVDSRAQAIFAKFIDDPSVVLTASDQEFIKMWQLEGELARFQKELEQNRNGFAVLGQIKKVGTNIKYGILGTAVVGTVALEQTLQTDITREESFDPKRSDSIKKQGTVELILPAASGDAEAYPILIAGVGVFKFNPMHVSWDLMQDSNDPSVRSEIMNSLQNSRGTFYRIRFNASAEQIKELSDDAHLPKYIDQGNGQPLYFDTPTAEVYRILHQEFKLPPLPIMNRMGNGSTELVNYFKLLKATGGSAGPVQEIYRVDQAKTSAKDKAIEIGKEGFSAYFDASFVLTAPYIDAAEAAYGLKESTVKQPK